MRTKTVSASDFAKIKAENEHLVAVLRKTEQEVRERDENINKLLMELGIIKEEYEQFKKGADSTIQTYHKQLVAHQNSLNNRNVDNSAWERKIQDARNDERKVLAQERQFIQKRKLELIQFIVDKF